MLTIYATLLTLLVIGGVFYVVTLLRKLFFFAENINELRMEVLDFLEHLKSLYSMEMFYGDETLKALITHTKHLKEKIEEFEDFYELLYEEEDFEEEKEELEPPKEEIKDEYAPTKQTAEEER
jgi:hypothetical protein